MRSKLPYIAAIVFLFAGCGKKAEVEEEVLRPVRYTVVKSGSSISSVHFSGVAQSANQSNLSFRVAGNVINVNVKEGQRVSKGQVLAQLDATDYRVQLEQSQANLKQAEVSYQGVESQVQVALSNYRRVESLYENNSVSLSEFEQAKNNYENARAQVEASAAAIAAARTAVNAASNQVSYTTLTAPYEGIIQKVEVDVNERVMAGKVVMIINGEGETEVSVGIPESVINEVKEGMNAITTYPALPNMELRGVVSEIGFDPDNASTYPVTIEITDEDERIKPGMAARVRFTFSGKKPEKSEDPVIPAKAVAEDNIGIFVFKLEDNGDGTATAKRTDVTVGELTEDGFEINEGLENGDLIATAGLKTLLNGMKVKLMDRE